MPWAKFIFYFCSINALFSRAHEVYSCCTCVIIQEFSFSKKKKKNNWTIVVAIVYLNCCAVSNLKCIFQFA